LYLMVLILYLLFLRKPILHYTMPSSAKWWSMAVALLLFALIMIGKIFIYDDINTFDYKDDILVSSLVVFGIVFFILVFDVVRNINKASEAENSRLMADVYASKLKAIQRHEESYQQVLHDRQHHVLMLVEMIEKEDKKAALEYLDNLRSESHISEVVRYSENEVVNSVVSAFFYQAQREKVNFAVSASVPKELKIKSPDLVAIISNLLDNAVRGAKECPQQRKEVLFKCSYDKGRFTIICRNTSKDNVHFKKGIPEISGLGISSIIATAKKYSGETRFLSEHGTFLARIDLLEEK